MDAYFVLSLVGKVNNNKLRVSVVYPSPGTGKNIGYKGYSNQMRISPEVGFLSYGVTKQCGEGNTER